MKKKLCLSHNLEKSLFVSFTVPILFIGFAYSLDRAYTAIGQDGGCIGIFYRCWFTQLALSSLFTIIVFLFLWYIVTLPPKQPTVLFILLVFTITIFLYPYLRGFFPFLTFSALRSIPLLAQLNHILSDSSPRSFLTLAALLVTLCVFYSLWHLTRK
jgi:hypothetical protein